jgi:hypothetical protein
MAIYAWLFKSRRRARANIYLFSSLGSCVFSAYQRNCKQLHIFTVYTIIDRLLNVIVRYIDTIYLPEDQQQPFHHHVFVQHLEYVPQLNLRCILLTGPIQLGYEAQSTFETSRVWSVRKQYSVSSGISLKQQSIQA